MLITAIRQTNPRPEERPARQLSNRHTIAVMVMFVLGILNDPLFTLFAPAVLLGLWLSHVKLSWWQWLTLIIGTAYGMWAMINLYVAAEWSFAVMRAIQNQDRHIPYIVFGAWREPARWIQLTSLIIDQYTLIGVLLGIIGIARLARWYPTLGIVMMAAYGSYSLFGLTYFGQDIATLLLPLFIVQTIAITYAVYTLSQWTKQSFQSTSTVPQWIVTGIFALLPLTLFLRVLSAN